MKDKITVEDIIELLDPGREGKDVVIVEDNVSSLVSTISLMLFQIGDIPIDGISTSDRGDIKLWLNSQALKEQWERETR